jgi:hypothetical protein
MKRRKSGMRLIQKAFLIAGILFLTSAGIEAQTVSPMAGTGFTQWFANDGTPLVNGALYFYQSGTTTQQATFTTSDGLTQNVNPLPFGSGARVNVWLTTSAFYKIVLCAVSTDGPFCSAGNTLAIADNVPGGAAGGSSGTCATGCTGFFVSGTATPATSGVLRCASGDLCLAFRNAAGSANLGLTKDASDLLSWPTPLKFPENAGATGVAGFDLLWPDNSVHRWKMANNGGTSDTVAGAATVDTFTNKTFDAQGSGNNFKIGGISISNTGQSATTFLRGDGAWGGDGLLNAQANAAAITGTGSAVVFYTYTLPANTIANLKGIRVTAGWNHSTGTASVTYILSLNGVTAFNTFGVAVTGGFSSTTTILNTGATTGTAVSSWGELSGTLGGAQTMTGLAWSSSQVLQITFNVAATDQVTPIQWLVEAIQ